MEKARNVTVMAFFSLATPNLEYVFKSVHILLQHFLKVLLREVNVTSLNYRSCAPCVNLLMNTDSCH